MEERQYSLESQRKEEKEKSTRSHQVLKDGRFILCWNDQLPRLTASVIKQMVKQQAGTYFLYSTKKASSNTKPQLSLKIENCAEWCNFKSRMASFLMSTLDVRSLNNHIIIKHTHTNTHTTHTKTYTHTQTQTHKQFPCFPSRCVCSMTEPLKGSRCTCT